MTIAGITTASTTLWTEWMTMPIHALPNRRVG